MKFPDEANAQVTETSLVPGRTGQQDCSSHAASSYRTPDAAATDVTPGTRRTWFSTSVRN